MYDTMKKHSGKRHISRNDHSDNSRGRIWAFKRLPEHVELQSDVITRR